jgi:hypothetical protein
MPQKSLDTDINVKLYTDACGGVIDIRSTKNMPLSRRLYVLLFTFGLPHPLFARPALGDPEWMRRFKIFVKAFNDFVDSLDDNKLDRAKWSRLCSAWRSLDPDQ